MHNDHASGASDAALGESDLSEKELNAMQSYLDSHAPSQEVVAASRRRLEVALAELAGDRAVGDSPSAQPQSGPVGGEAVSIENRRGSNRRWVSAVLWSSLSAAAATGLFVLTRSPGESANTETTRDVLTKGNGYDVPELSLWCGSQEIERDGASCPVGRAITAQLRAPSKARKLYTAVVICRHRAECRSLTGVGLSSSTGPGQLAIIDNTEAGTFDGFVFVAETALTESASVAEARAILEQGMGGLSADLEAVPFFWKAE